MIESLQWEGRRYLDESYARYGYKSARVSKQALVVGSSLGRWTLASLAKSSDPQCHPGFLGRDHRQPQQLNRVTTLVIA
jgi:hypothetical protein